MTKNAMNSRLPFPTKPLVINGVSIEEYIIPEEKKAEVLEDLYIFHPCPGLDDEQEDMHSGKRFKVRQFRVTRENGHNYLVSPFYEEGGGTVIDWIPVRRKKG
jgi:biotin carboxylase